MEYTYIVVEVNDKESGDSLPLAAFTDFLRAVDYTAALRRYIGDESFKIIKLELNPVAPV